MEHPFDEAWRACLDAHLRYVIAVGDTLNERSLIEVLKATGYTDADVSQVRREVLGEDAVVEDVQAEVEPERLAELAPLDSAPPDVGAVTHEEIAEPSFDVAAEVVMPTDEIDRHADSAPEEIAASVTEATPAIETIAEAAAIAAPPTLLEPPPQQLSLF